MSIYAFGFDEIGNQGDLYRGFSQALSLVEDRVRDLNSLWDMLMNDVLLLPLEIEFVHLEEKMHRYLNTLILLPNGTEGELEGHLRFNVRHQRKKKPPSWGQYRWTRR